jgi:photosystem II stability/assembly factor-like uncharacterized protein
MTGPDRFLRCRPVCVISLLYMLACGSSDASNGGAAQNAVSSVNITPARATLAPAGNATFVAVAQGAFANGSQVLSDGVQWTASGGTITSAGFYTAPTQLGSYQISATYGGVTGTATANVALATATWEPLKVGAGGWVVGMTIDPSGSTYLVRTDTYGAYVGNGLDTWKQLVTSDSMPANFVSSFTTGTVQNPASGVYEIVVAPTNPNLLYMFYGKQIFKSTNRGTTWTATAFSYTGTADPNGNYRYWGERMAVDPANANVVYVGTDSDGLYVTSDGGASWSLVPGVGVPGVQGITGIVFDGTSGTTGGKTNKIWATRNGTGVYASTDAGATWNLLAGGPTTTTHACVATDGVYYAANLTASVYKYTGGSWTSSVAASGQSIHSIACDPFNSARVTGGLPSGILTTSTDHGATWTGPIWGPGHPYRTATDVPWLGDGHATENYMSNGAMRFDPIVPNKLWFSEGIGVWNTTDPANLTATTWTSHSAGIEQLVAYDVISPPGSGNVFTAAADRSAFVVPKANATYPTDYLHMGSTASLIPAHSVSYSRLNPQHIVVLINAVGYAPGTAGLSGYSLDNGATWTKFPAQPAAGSNAWSGCIIAPSIDNIIAVIGMDGYAYRSTDRGVSWSKLAGVPGGLDAGQFSVKKHILAVDGAYDGTSNKTIYLYAEASGTWRSTDDGVTWSRVSATTFSGDHWSIKLRSVPGQSGHLFFAAGQQGGGGSQNPQTGMFLWRSTDGGATWAKVPGMGEPYDVALGVAAPGQSYPAIYVVGWYNNVYGIWLSTDNASTWTQIGPFPFGNMDLINVIAASQDVYGEVYVAFQGSGWGHGIVH